MQLYKEPLSDDIIRLLVVKGIRPSVQRLSIYAYISEHKNHPTVEMVFNALNPHIPTLSKTTVYNTMKLFFKNNIIQAIPIEDEEIRYDADICDHVHFKCRLCRGIFDVPLLCDKPIYELPQGFKKEKEHIFVWGICVSCCT